MCSDNPPNIGGIRIPESGKFLLVESEMEENLHVESGILGFGVRNTAEEFGIPLATGIQNASSANKGWNLVSGIRNPESMTWNPESETVLDSLTWSEMTYRTLGES